MVISTTSHANLEIFNSLDKNDKLNGRSRKFTYYPSFIQLFLRSRRLPYKLSYYCYLGRCSRMTNIGVTFQSSGSRPAEMSIWTRNFTTPESVDPGARVPAAHRKNTSSVSLLQPMASSSDPASTRIISFFSHCDASHFNSTRPGHEGTAH